jgi:hypothetical protein
MLLQFSVKQITEHPSFIYNKDYTNITEMQSNYKTYQLYIENIVKRALMNSLCKHAVNLNKESNEYFIKISWCIQVSPKLKVMIFSPRLVAAFKILLR